MLAVIVGAIAASPAMIAAVMNYYLNKANIAETYEGIALRATKENERLRVKNKDLQQELEDIQTELRRLRRLLEG